MTKLPDVVGFVDARRAIERLGIIWMDSRYHTRHLMPHPSFDPVLPLKAEYSVAVRDMVLEAPRTH
jgi:hypothetical protein